MVVDQRPIQKRGDPVPTPLGFNAFWPECLERRGDLDRPASFRRPRRRSGRIPAAPYPPSGLVQVSRNCSPQPHTGSFCTYYGSEFSSKSLDVWAWQLGVQLVLITPGRPVENGYVGSFNGRLRDECLKVSLFFSLADVREQLQRWQKDYNQLRPHSSLDDRTPNEFAQIWNKRSFALTEPDYAFASARQGYPDGALTRGLDPPARTPVPLAMRAKLPPRLHPLAGVT
jgi:hypothetical protein